MARSAAGARAARAALDRGRLAQGCSAVATIPKANAGAPCRALTRRRVAIYAERTTPGRIARCSSTVSRSTDAQGAVLAHGVKAGDVVLRKGRRLTAGDLDRLRAAGVESVVAARFERRRRAGEPRRGGAGGHCSAVRWWTPPRPSPAGPTFTPRPAGCCWSIAQRVDRFNRDRRGGDAGHPARICGGRAAADGGHGQDHPVRHPGGAAGTLPALRWPTARSVRVAPFRPWRARLIQTELPSVAAKVLDKTVRITRDRVAARGGELVGETRCAHEPGGCGRRGPRARSRPAATCC